MAGSEDTCILYLSLLANPNPRHMIQGRLINRGVMRNAFSC